MTGPTLESLVLRAVRRAESELGRSAPFLAGEVGRWMRELWPTRRPEDFFLQPDRFPFLMLPWWLEGAIRGARDPDFQADLVYSSVNGYYFIRLVDDAMDGHSAARADLLPATSFFHTEFQAAYHRRFPADHPFWDLFRQIWFGAADAVTKDAGRGDIDRRWFENVSSKKVSAAKIPLGAVCHRYGAAERWAAWAELCDGLGRLEQLLDDLFDWRDDLEGGAGSWFLSEARRRKAAEESVTAWFVREGFEWGMETCRECLIQLRDSSVELGSPEAEDHLRRREARLLERRAELLPGLRSLAAVADSMGHH